MKIPKLLLVLDPEDIIEFQKNLEILGYSVIDSISDGELAIKQAAALRPDLVLISINLERGKSGIETGMEIYDQFDIPIIYLSDQSSHNTIRRSGGTAPFGYLFKPFDGRQVLAIIELALTRHRLEKKVRDSESWLNAILENIGDGVIALGLDRRIRFLNPVAETLLNLDASDAEEKLLSEVLTLTDETTYEILQVESMLDCDKKQGRHFVSTALLRTKDGSEIPVEVQISPIQKDNQHLGSVVVIHDISEQRAAMREIRMQAKDFIPSERKVQLILDVLDFPDSLLETAQSPVPSWGLQMFGGAQVFGDPIKAEIFRSAVKKIQETALLQTKRGGVWPATHTKHPHISKF